MIRKIKKRRNTRRKRKKEKEKEGKGLGEDTIYNFIPTDLTPLMK